MIFAGRADGGADVEAGGVALEARELVVAEQGVVAHGVSLGDLNEGAGCFVGAVGLEQGAGAEVVEAVAGVEVVFARFLKCVDVVDDGLEVVVIEEFAHEQPVGVFGHVALWVALELGGEALSGLNGLVFGAQDSAGEVHGVVGVGVVAVFFPDALEELEGALTIAGVPAAAAAQIKGAQLPVGLGAGVEDAVVDGGVGGVLAKFGVGAGDQIHGLAALGGLGGPLFEGGA